MEAPTPRYTVGQPVRVSCSGTTHATRVRRVRQRVARGRAYFEYATVDYAGSTWHAEGSLEADNG
jgi:hypothetical protein